MTKNVPDFEILPHLNHVRMCHAYERAPGREQPCGKKASAESSSALVANAFGLFVDQAKLLPVLPGLEELAWDVERVCLDHPVRFPWSGGMHPWLDVYVETRTHMVGVDSKRYEPFRAPHTAAFSGAYWRNLWNPEMAAYLELRDELRMGSTQFSAIDAAQIVKHALALSHEARRKKKPAVLVYLYSQPKAWGDGRAVEPQKLQAHEEAVNALVERLADAPVRFHALSYEALLAEWLGAGDAQLRFHAAAVARGFQVRVAGGAY